MYWALIIAEAAVVIVIVAKLVMNRKAAGGDAPAEEGTEAKRAEPELELPKEERWE